MANSNKVFVSPGVYTSEKDLTFVAQSVGVTTLGLVGETLKGPAFEPILVGSFDEFRTYFGTTSPLKDGAGNPKYELPYVAKSYLQEANQLFVTRILGLTGYQAGKSYGLKLLGGVTVDTDTTPSTSGGTFNVVSLATVSGGTFFAELSGKTSTDGSSITTYLVENFSGNTTGNTNEWFVIGSVPDSATSGLTGTQLDSPIGANANKNWYNEFYHKTGATDSTIDGVYSYLLVYNGSTFGVTRFKFDASLNTDYHDRVVCVFRSRGSYSQNVLEQRVTGSTSAVTVSGSNLANDPLSELTLSVTDVDGDIRTFECSLDTASKIGRAHV